MLPVSWHCIIIFFHRQGNCSSGRTDHIVNNRKASISRKPCVAPILLTLHSLDIVQRSRKHWARSQLTLIQCLPHVRHFVSIASLYLHNNPRTGIIPCYRLANWGSERLSNLTKFMHIVSEQQFEYRLLITKLYQHEIWRRHYFCLGRWLGI